MTKRVISLLLAMLMVASILPLQLFAAGTQIAAVPTTVQSSSMENQNQASGIIYTKTSTAMSDGTVDITLTAHTTGKVETLRQVSPTDIVLVLDVSGSMDQNYQTTATTSYSAVYGDSYEYEWDGFLFWGEWIYAYGMEETEDEYYVNVGTAADPVYTRVTFTGRDANKFEMYEYTHGTTEEIVYPALSSGVTAPREHDHAVVQFYTANTSSQSVNKMESLQEAVKNFIDETARMNDGLAKDEMHTISIVKFASAAYYNANNLLAEGNHKGANRNSNYNYSEVVKNLTPVDAAGATTLKAAVDALSPGGATAVDYGLTLAEAVLQNRSAVADADAVDRQEVVIVFTDGAPTHESDFSNTVANAAIVKAGDMERTAGVTVYGVCIDSNADAEDTGANINKFMHYMTSNFPNATGMNSPGEGGSIANGYYLTPDDTTSLSKLFTEIIQDIGHPTVALGEEATLVDTLSPYFDFENGTATNVTLAVSTRKADGTWEDPVVDSHLSYEIVGDRLSVNGFDFDANFVSDTGRGENDDFYGKRLVISFTVIPDYDVIDAAGVSVINSALPTNTIASLVDSTSASVAEVQTPILATHQITYTVDGTQYKVFDRLTGAADSVLSAPTKTGYTFSGWSYPANITVDASGNFVMPNEDVTITGTFVANTYDVTYVYGNTPAGASALPAAQQDVAYGTNVTVAPDATAPGYIFGGWEPLEQDVTVSGGTFSMPDHSVTLRGTFIAANNTAYTVEHYLETMTDGVYALHETENKYGETDTSVTAIPKYYDGFTYDAGNANEVLSGTISASTPLVLKLYYTRNTYEVTYGYTGDVPSNAPAAPAAASYKYGETVTVEADVSVPGYTFEGWESLSVTAKAGETFSMPAHGVAFVGEFGANSDTEYTVEYYLENLAGNGYDLHPDANYTSKAATGATVHATKKTFDGFTFDAANTNNKASGVVAGDGSLVLQLYYTRNSYTVTYAYDGTQPTGAPALPVDTNTYKYGATVPVAGDLAFAGYVFNGWYSTNLDLQVNGTFVMPAENVTLLGDFEPSTGTAWVEEHYFENLDGSYPTTPKYSFDHTGTTGATAEAEPIQEEVGFTFDALHAENVTSATIAADGSTVLKFHYKRNTHTVTYAYEGTQPTGAPALPVDTNTYKYGEEVTVKGDLALTGYTFVGWHSTAHMVGDSDATFEMPDRDVTLYGDFEPAAGILYKEIHYLQNADGTYTDAEVYYERNHYGTTGDTVTAARMTPTGYTFDTAAPNVESATIAADGSTVLKFHYKRSEYTVTYKYDPAEQPTGAPTVPAAVSYKYGATVTVEDPLLLTGYTFAGWYPEQSGIPQSGSFTMPAYDVVFEGGFLAKSDTKYEVHHHLQKADGTYPADPDYVNEHSGTTGAEVTAIARNFAGYTLASTAPVKGIVKADGSLVLDLFYDRNTYTVTYYLAGLVPTGVSAPTDTNSPYRHGEEVIVLPAMPAPAGITFVGWTPVAQSSAEANVTITGGKFEMPMHNVRLEGTFTANSDIPYVIHHWTEKETMDGYENYSTDNRTGTTGETVTAYGLTIPGFTDVTAYPAGATERKIEAQVLGDGSLEIHFYYDRNVHNVTYAYEGMTPDGAPALPAGLTDVPFDKKVTVAVTPAVPGYTFEGWLLDGTKVTEFAMPDRDVELVGKFASNLVSYKVNYWFQKLDAGNTFDPSEYDLSASSYERQAYVGQYVQVDDLPHLGFTVNRAQSKGHANVTVDANGVGNLVLNIYFDRNVYNVTYTYYGTQPAQAPDISDRNIEKVRYGTPLTVAEKAHMFGYTFEGWYTHTADVVDGAFTMPNHDVVFLGYFEKKTTPPGGGDPTPSRVVLTYDSNGGTEYEREKYAKGTVVTLDKVPVKEGYTFAGWYEDEALSKKITEVTMYKDRTVYAGWTRVTDPNHPVPDDLDGEHHIAYVIGYPDDTVRPLAHITRAEVTTILFRLLKEDVRKANLTDENTYKDVSEKAWYNTAIATLTKMGIVHGRSETEFAPDAYITRAEFAAFCARFDETVIDFKEDFTDIDGHWAEAYIHEAAARGWVKGYSDGTFRPEQPITRAEAMALINRVLCRIPETEDDLLSSMIQWPDNAKVTEWYYLDVQEATNSHIFTYKNGSVYEKWLKLIENPDWEEYN